MKEIYDMVVIGGGPGGYTAALYAARGGLSVLVAEQLWAGGQMALTDRIDNYPGFPQGVDGVTLSLSMQRGAEKAGAVTRYGTVTEARLSGSVKTVVVDGVEISARTVVIATGAAPRKLNIPGEESRGVSYCAHCDGMFYKDKTVAVIGGGSSAAAEALHLANIARKVYLIHRRDTLRASKSYEKPLMQRENVEILWNSIPREILSDEAVRGLVLEDTVTGALRELPCQGVFVSIGRVPSSGLFVTQLPADNAGYLIAGSSCETEIPGVYVAGDVRQKDLRQIVTAVSDGATAADSAMKYLAE